MHRRHLLFSFVGLALVFLVLFGILAYRIAEDTALDREYTILQKFADHEASEISGLLNNGYMLLEILKKYHIESNSFYITILDSKGNPVPQPGPKEDLPWRPFKVPFSAIFSDQEEQGSLFFNHHQITWVRKAIPDSIYSLVLFFNDNSKAKAPLETLGARLAVTGIFIIWLAIWAALILYGVISRKTQKLELERQKADEQVRLLLDSTAEGIIGVDVEGNCVFCNPSAINMLGYDTEKDLLGQSIRRLLKITSSPDSDLLSDVVEHGKGIHVAYEEFHRADRTTFPVEYKIYPIRRESQIIGGVVSFLDITQRYNAEQEMMKLSRVVDQATDAVFITNPDGVIEYVNPAFENMTGYTKQDIVGKDFTILKETDVNKHQILNSIRTESIYQNLSINKKKDGTNLFTQEIVAALKDNTNTIRNFVFTSKDVSSQLKLEEKMQSAIRDKQDAEQANREKSAFLARMSHELRTPLNAIIGYSELLQDEFNEQEEKSEYISDLKKIHAAGNHLLALINDVLDFSKIEAGKMEFYFDEFPVKEMVNEIVHIIQPLMKKNRNEFSIKVPAHIGSMFSDTTRVRQCLFNLLSNAAKFTSHGKVSLVIDKYEYNHEEWICFEVSDTGIGIDQEQVNKLFREFSQLDAKNFQGTGLGLAISQRICRILGGEIKVNSKVGEGSVFSMRLPARQNEKSGLPATNKASAKMPASVK
jgi:PAS domain S-box-containing protein